MKILSRKAQRRIERDRDKVVKYLANCVQIGATREDLREFEDALEALADLSCECGIWSNPFDGRVNGEKE